MGVPISNVTRRVVYSASGTGPYAFTFEILTNTDIAVFKDDTLLTLSTDYTVTIASNGTGSITLVTAPTGATQIAIVGNRTIKRLSDFVTGGDFFANTVNDELDQQTIFAQQNAEGLNRALQAPQTDPTSINMTLPRATARANKSLAFDASGNPVVGEIIGENRGNWAAAVAYNKRDIVRDNSNGNVYYANTAHTSTGTTPISSNADTAKWDLIVNNAAAGTSATAAAASATAASTSATNAASSASSASSSATAASGSATTASTQASNASSSASSASTSASTASTQASNASTSATNAATSATNASNSATSASTSASTATTQASNASTSASNASTSATNAANSASSASSSATTATTQATTATTQATNAAASAAAAAASFDAFDDIYLGAKSSDPTVDNDGNALTTGDQYFNTASNELRVYNGSTWQAASTVGGTVTSLNVTGTATLSGGTANGVAYLNGSKVLTTGSSLNWNGSLLGVGRTPTGMRVEIDGNLGLNTSNTPGANGNGISIYSSDFPRLSFRNLTTGDTTSDGLAMYMVGSDFTYDLQESGYQAWRINGSEQMRLTSTGLGIGTTSPASKLDVVGRTFLKSTSDEYSLGLGYSSAASAFFYVGASANATPDLVFTNGAVAERMRLTNAGNLLVGTTSAYGGPGRINVGFDQSTNFGITLRNISATATGVFVSFENSGGGGNGSISQVNSSAILYNTSSDYRLKNITGPITNSGAYIDSLNPVEGTWKADGSTFVGLIAHETQEASRTTVATGIKDGAEMQSMDYSSAEIIGNMIAELKSLRKRLADAGI